MTKPTAPVTTVVAGIDDSDTATDALRWADAFAREVDAPLSVVHTWPMPVSMALSAAEVVGPVLRALQEQAEGVAAKAIAGAGIEPDTPTDVEQGRAGPRLCSLAEAGDLLVVGRTGRGRRQFVSRAAEILLGSTALYCLHHSPAPVAAIPRGATWPTDRPRVVVGVDGSPASLRALDWAARHVPGDPEITALLTFYPWVSDPLAPVDDSYREAAISAAAAELDAWVDSTCADKADTVRRVIRTGDARTELTDPGLEADLVVVGTRGRTGVARFVLGSVAEHVVRNARCPVVVVPPADRS